MLKSKIYLPKSGSSFYVEVKFSENPQPRHTRSLSQFIQENPKKASVGYIIFAGDRARQIDQNIIALPWFDLYRIFDQ